MKSIILKSVTLLLICAGFFAFTSKPGGEGFEIYLNDKVVLQQFGSEMNTVKSISLQQSSKNETLRIKYYHCGRIGKERLITIKNGQDKVLKVFRYKDAAVPSSTMTLEVKEVLNLKNGSTLKLYYSSSELTKGRLLATILVPDNSK